MIGPPGLPKLGRRVFGRARTREQEHTWKWVAGLYLAGVLAHFSHHMAFDLPADHIDPSFRDQALAIVDDELGYPWLTWQGQRLDLADVQMPGDTAAVGRSRQRYRQHLAPEYSYDDVLPAHYWEPSARVRQVSDMGLDGAVLFPNYGLLWERRLSGSLGALTANMAAWNRWCATVVADAPSPAAPVPAPVAGGAGSSARRARDSST